MDSWATDCEPYGAVDMIDLLHRLPCWFWYALLGWMFPFDVFPVASATVETMIESTPHLKESGSYVID